jgi:tripartite-type tricarboxylate transporter receptor subunit TctC
MTDSRGSDKQSIDAMGPLPRHDGSAARLAATGRTFSSQLGRESMNKPQHHWASRRAIARNAIRLVACASIFFPSEAGWAGSYPDGKLIKLVSGAAAGSATDIIGRAFAETLKSELGVPVILENRTGATGIIAARAILSAPADGHTILVQTGSHTILPFVAQVDYDPLRDFSGVTPLASVPNVLVVAGSGTYKVVQDLVRSAKAQPGQLTFGSVGVGSTTYMSAVKFNRAAGLDALHVPFKGGVEAITETMTGRIDYFFAPIISALPQIQGGNLRPLAVNTVNRVSQLPDVPTLAETGISDADYLFWVGLLVSSHTQRDIIERLNQIASKALQARELRSRLLELGAEPLSMSAEQFDILLRDETAIAASVFKSAGSKR